MTEKKKPKGQMFTKGGKGGPGRPSKDKSKPEAATSTNIRRRFFNVFWDEITEKELKDLISTKKNRMLFIQEIRRMLPTTAEFDRTSEPKGMLNIIIAPESESMKKLESEMTALRLEMSKKDRFIEAYEKALKKAGVVLELKHEPKRPLELAEGQNGTFRSDAETHLDDEPEEDEEDHSDRRY